MISKQAQEASAFLWSAHGMMNIALHYLCLCKLTKNPDLPQSAMIGYFIARQKHCPSRNLPAWCIL